MPIRLATKEDISLLYSMCVRFYKTTHYTFPIHETFGKAFLEHHLDQSDRLSLVLEDKNKEGIGCLLAISAEHPFSPVRVSNELVWWVNPEARGTKASFDLLKAYEYWAVNKMKCRYVCLVSSDDPRLETYYKRKKYKMVEKTWFKEYNQCQL